MPEKQRLAALRARLKSSKAIKHPTQTDLADRRDLLELIKTSNDQLSVWIAKKQEFTVRRRAAAVPADADADTEDAVAFGQGAQLQDGVSSDEDEDVGSKGVECG